MPSDVHLWKTFQDSHLWVPHFVSLWDPESPEVLYEKVPFLDPQNVLLLHPDLTHRVDLHIYKRALVCISPSQWAHSESAR